MLLANLNARTFIRAGEVTTRNTGADSGLMIRSPMSNDTKTEKQNMNFSYPTRLVSVF